MVFAGTMGKFDPKIEICVQFWIGCTSVGQSYETYRVKLKYLQMALNGWGTGNCG